jgi:hypothetical protein
LGAELFHAEGPTEAHTNKKKPIVAFRKFAKSAKVNTKSNRSA